MQLIYDGRDLLREVPSVHGCKDICQWLARCSGAHARGPSVAELAACTDRPTGDRKLGATARMRTINASRGRSDVGIDMMGWQPLRADRPFSARVKQTPRTTVTPATPCTSHSHALYTFLSCPPPPCSNHKSLPACILMLLWVYLPMLPAVLIQHAGQSRLHVHGPRHAPLRHFDEEVAFGQDHCRYALLLCSKDKHRLFWQTSRVMS